MKIPGPDHPISIEMSRSHIVVSVAGVEIASGRRYQRASGVLSESSGFDDDQ
jgi:hypothetical protein